MHEADEAREAAKANTEGTQSFKRMSTLGKAAAKLAGENVEGTVYKIKYTLNLLPSMLEQDGRLIPALAASEELDIFNCSAVKELLQFKW
jgi:hypothetical protein